MRSPRPDWVTKRSQTTRARVTPSWRRCSPVSAEAPAPKTTRAALNATIVARASLTAGSPRARYRRRDRGDRLVDRDHVAVLRVDVQQRPVVGVDRPVRHALARHQHAVAVLERVDGRRPHAARGGRTGDEHRVAARLAEHLVELRAEERGREELDEHRLLRSRPSRASTSTQGEPGRSVASAGALAMNIAARSRSSSA